MSTIDRLQELVAAGTLVEWSSPVLPVRVKRRTFLVTDDVKKVLDTDPWPAGYFGETAKRAQDRRLLTHTLINQFVEGQNLTVGVNDDDSDIKCLFPIERVADWRVVELRAAFDRRTTRVFGEFAALDVFVALRIKARKVIGKRDWDRLAGAVDAEWLRLFPGEPPLHWNAAPTAKDFGKNYSDC